MIDFGSDLFLFWALGLCTGFVFGMGFVLATQTISEWRERNRERIKYY